MASILPNLRLDLMTNLKVFHLEGDNGDSAMHPDLETILDAAIQISSSPNIHIVTNGSMRQPEWWAALAKKYGSKLIIQFSIDGLRDTHCLYRVGSDYDRVIKNAEAFIQAGGIAKHRCLIFEHNKHQLQQISDLSRDMGFKKMIFLPGDRFRFQGQEEWPVYWKNKQTHTIKPVVSIFREHYRPFEFDFLELTLPQTPNKSLCPFSRQGQLHITYKGHVLPCCMLHADLYFQHPSNDQFKQFVGDVNLIDVNIRPLDQIFSDSNFYIHRLQTTLASESRLPRCQTHCSADIDNQINRLRNN